MKYLAVLLLMMLSSYNSYSQVFKSDYIITQKAEFESNRKDRIISINDDEITITNFLNGSTKTLYLIINKREIKEYDYSNANFYYCTTKFADPINGYQEAILIHQSDQIILGLFTSDIDIYRYVFSISR
jgi:hypothetical protein